MQIRPPALKALSRLSRPDRERIRAAIDRLPEGDVRPLQGASGLWRLRVGDWRIRYRRDDTERIVDVTAVDPRGDAYKKL